MYLYSLGILVCNFLLHYSCGFGITAVLALGNELGSVPYSYILWKSLRGIGINLKVWFSSLVNSIWS